MSEVFEYPLKMLVLSHSTSSGFRSCARRGIEFKKFYGIRSIETDEFGNPDDGYAGNCGTALHIGYQDYLVNRNEDQAIYKFGLHFPVRTELNQKDQYRNLEACFATLELMFGCEASSRFEIVQIKTTAGNQPAIEVPYAIEIVGSPMKIPVYHVGVIDFIAWDRYEERFIVVDIKTHRDNTTDLSLKYKFDEQPIPYGIILEHILGKKVEEFTVGFLSCYIDLLEPRIRLYEFTKRQEDLRDWYMGLCNDIRQISIYAEQMWFPRATNGGTCMAFRKRCGYEEVCAYRDPLSLSQMLGGEPRDTLFHDGKEPWISLQMPYYEGT